MRLKPDHPTLTDENNAGRRIENAIDKVAKQKRHRPGREDAEKEVDAELNDTALEEHAKDVLRAINKNTGN